jgi:hypothetical protein
MYQETVWDFESKGSLGEICVLHHASCSTASRIVQYYITHRAVLHYASCSFILQVLELALGLTQLCSSWVQGLFPRGRVDGS